jgi:hypothetical protein
VAGHKGPCSEAAVVGRDADFLAAISNNPPQLAGLLVVVVHFYFLKESCCGA